MNISKYQLFTLNLLLWGCFCNYPIFAQNETAYPVKVQKLISAYPDFIKEYKDNYLIFNDNSKLIFDDGKSKSHDDLMKSPDIEDTFAYSYTKGIINLTIEKNSDPGRIRNDEFFKKMYGGTTSEVQKKLVEITWCPALVGQKLRITSVNNVHLQLQKISNELDKHPEWKDYLKSAGTFNWRIIRGTNRLSTHSFGIAIDLNVKYSHYWQWDCKCTTENTNLSYKNQIPQGIVDIFEKYGFIWGGKWYHYDTMHFEYRPELL